MTDCIFCKIVKGEIPSYRIAESDDFLAFLDIAPINKGHTMVIPKRHFVDFSEFPTELGTSYVKFVKEVMGLLMKGLQADGLNIGSNNGKASGQMVMHQHTHLIPRWNGDGLPSWPQHEATPDELTAVTKEILG